MKRRRSTRILLFTGTCVFSLILLKLGLSSHSQEHRIVEEIDGFQDLDGSHKVLEPLVIHDKLLPLVMHDNKQLTLKAAEHNTSVKSIQNTSLFFKIDSVTSNLPDDVLAMNAPTLLDNYKNPCWLESADKIRCLPYFHLIGVDKSGTTDLWFRLTKHPDIVRPEAVMGKETHWWSWRRFGFDIWTEKARIQHMNEYIKVFDKPAAQIETQVALRNKTIYHHLITGEGSPTVFWDMTGWNRIPQNKDRSVENAFLTPHCISHFTPNAKLIVIFRNPTDRLYSDYLFLQLFRPSKTPLTAQTFHDDVVKSISMLRTCTAAHSLKACLYNKTLHIEIPVRIPISYYAVYLKEWLEVFPRENILVLRNEDYSADIKGHIQQVYNFLDLKKLPDAELSRIANLTRAFTRNKDHEKAGNMLPSTRILLNNFHQELNNDLATLLKNDRFKWNGK